MNRDPPLPYVGAITLKNLLENPALLNDPMQIQQQQKDKDKDSQDDNQINAMFRSSALMGNSIWDSSSIIPYTDIDDFKVELLDNEVFWDELNALNRLGDNSNPLPELVDFLPDARKLCSGMDESSLDLTKSTETISQGQQSSPTSPGSRGSPTLAGALMANPNSPRSSSSSPQPPKQHFFDKYSPDALVLASVPGEGLFNPGERKFNTEELKPQPIIKKSRKTFVPDDLKDDRYWQRRRKNNTAAKRSRDAKRIKENQIALRAAFLEEENDYLRKQLAKFKAENKSLKGRLDAYEHASP